MKFKLIFTIIIFLLIACNRNNEQKIDNIEIHNLEEIKYDNNEKNNYNSLIHSTPVIKDRPFIIANSEYFVLGDWFRIMSQPNKDSEIIETLTPSNKVQIIEYTGIEERTDYALFNWYKIKYNEIEGYILIDTFTYDINGSGIYDYIYCRLSLNDNQMVYLKPTDIYMGTSKNYS